MGEKKTTGRPKGRPKGSYARGTPHCGRLVISCTEQEEAMIRALAKRQGRSISRYLVEIALERYAELQLQGIELSINENTETEEDDTPTDSAAAAAEPAS